MLIKPKDYIVTNEGLFFAVVIDILEAGRVLTYLRYKKNTIMEKLETDLANKLIKKDYPEFIFHSQYADIELHGVPVAAIEKHYCATDALVKLLAVARPDPKQQDAIHIINLFINAGIEKGCLGITGSMMLDAHNEHSDIDIVVYGRANFFKIQELIKQKIHSGSLKKMDHTSLMLAYQRRGCELDFKEYCEHETKKYNKCISGVSKVDISLLPTDKEKIKEHWPYKKLRRDKIRSMVIDDTYAYDFPSRYFIAHETIKEVVSYTFTYTGQARSGEMIEAAGYIEQGNNGKNRLLVGTNREAIGEYIRVLI